MSSNEDSNDDNNGHDDDPPHSGDDHDTSSEAAGVVRGITRSLGRTTRALMRFPEVGSLPRSSIPRKLPVRQVAKVSDRLSTGLDLWSSAVESTERRAQWQLRASRFLKSVVKNTLLGAAVFETYETMVSQLAPPMPLDEDVYARASLGSHYVAGCCGGAVHGVLSVAWDVIAGAQPLAGQQRAMSSTYVPAMTIHHSIAHSILFGSYETIKRELLRHQSSRHEEMPYFASVTLAGGLAGQIQHVVSHYTEHWLRLDQPSSRQLVRFTTTSPPTLRSTVLAFPPAAISFVAFEYGKSFLSSSS